MRRGAWEGRSTSASTPTGLLVAATSTCTARPAGAAAAPTWPGCTPIVTAPMPELPVRYDDPETVGSVGNDRADDSLPVGLIGGSQDEA